MRIRDVTPFLLHGDEEYGAEDDRLEATDQGDTLLLVRVRTDDGIEAWSDVETLADVAVAVIAGRSMGAMGFRTLAEVVTGRDPLEIEERWNEMYVASAYYGRRGVVMQCMSAIDNCLWSIAAQAAGMPLSELLGGRRRDLIPAYASTLFRPTPESNARAARWYVERGFRGVKFGWGGFGMDSGRDRACLEAIREELGTDRALMVDPGWYVDDHGTPRLRSREQIDTMLTGIADFSPYWVEDFIPPDEVEQYGVLAEEFPSLRFAAGEQQATRWEFERLLASGGVQVVQPDLSRCGGLTVARTVAAMAERLDIELVTHSWLTDLLHSYSLHFLATLSNATWVEFNVAQSVLSRGATMTHLGLDEGTVAVPTGPGIGVMCDSGFIGAHRASAA